MSASAALATYPAGTVGGVVAAEVCCALGVRPSIALRTAARAPAPRRRVTAGVGEASRSGRDARLLEALAELAARQETARATQAPGPPAYRVRFHLRSPAPSPRAPGAAAAGGGAAAPAPWG